MGDSGLSQIYLAPGFAHGFCVLSDWADLHYKVSATYDPGDEGGLLWRDENIGIQWPSFQRSLSKEAYSDSNAHTVIKLSNISIATSGDYRNYRDFDGRRYSHIISPKTGYPVENKIISVSVISKECLNADALATALMVMDVEDGINLVEKLDGYESFFILEDNSTRYSSGIKDFLN